MEFKKQGRKNETNEHALKYREEIDGCQREGWFGRWVKKIKEIQRYSFPVVNESQK